MNDSVNFSLPRSHVRTFTRSYLLLLLFAASALAQTQPRGTIGTDTVWSGQIALQADTVIAGATVRVQPGSVVQFTANGKARGGLVLSLRAPTGTSIGQRRPARLILDGTPDQPITIETPESITPGIIDAAPGTSAAITGRHVIFRRLGGWPTGERTCKPAVSVQLAAADNDLWLSDCRFEQCGPVRAEFIGPDSSSEISHCTFSRTVGPTALVLAGPGTGIKVLQDNIADAGFETACPQVLIRNNVLIGEAAALIVRNRLAGGITITGNYVHCTWREDTGRYALRCEPASSRIIDNVLVGGSYVLETAPQTVRGNVLIGTSHLGATFDLGDAATPAPRMETTTHSLVTNTCANSVLADNLFLGPAYAAINVGKGSNGLRIEHNIFDAWGLARRALDFDITARDGPRVEFKDNMVAGYRQPPIHNEARADATALHAGNNTFVALTGPAYQGFNQNGDAASLNQGPAKDLASGDRRAESLSALGLAQAAASSPATQAAADVDELLTTGRKTVADVRKAWFDIYRPAK
jgi:hypothetical protein